jgi:hypothetical protein
MDTPVANKSSSIAKKLVLAGDNLENAVKTLNTTPKAWDNGVGRECDLARELAARKLQTVACELLMALQELGFKEGVNMIYDLSDALIDEMDEKKE